MSVVRFRHVHYSPDDDIKGVLDALPDAAQRSVDVEIYGLTDLALITGLIAAANRGVDVQVMNDRSQASGPADKHALQMLTDAGAVNGKIAVRVVESEHGAIDHLKLLIVDGVDGALADTSSVFYGSYNFSDGAQKQDNIAVYTNDPGEVAQAMAKFGHDWFHNKQDAAWQIAPTHPPIGGPQPVATAEAQATALQAAVPRVAQGAAS